MRGRTPPPPPKNLCLRYAQISDSNHRNQDRKIHFCYFSLEILFQVSFAYAKHTLFRENFRVGENVRKQPIIFFIVKIWQNIVLYLLVNDRNEKGFDATVNASSGVCTVVTIFNAIYFGDCIILKCWQSSYLVIVGALLRVVFNLRHSSVKNFPNQENYFLQVLKEEDMVTFSPQADELEWSGGDI